ncbi:MAG: YdiU family protein [Myxococcales bacterium]|nr:YdiU family protein [Myxococcales bacterium]
MSDYRPDPRILALSPASNGGSWGELWDEAGPARFPMRRLRFRNQRKAETVGLASLSDADWERHFACFEPLPDNLPHPLALRYHGHQFRHYNPQLGDGRGFLYAQLREVGTGATGRGLPGTTPAGRLLDLGTKGSGTTLWSRGGDGRLTLKGGVREILATEMLEALGVDTSKTFSLYETGEELYRGDEPSPTRSSVLVRLSHSHVRFGSFQRLAYVRDRAGLERLLAYAIEHYHPTATGPADFLRAVCQAAAETCGRWMAAGFVHGVLNTDNMNITGESFDYGPWRFVPTFDGSFTAAYFDHEGLYAYGRQPSAVRWNLQQLASALSGLGAAATASGSPSEPEIEAELAAALEGFPGAYFGGLRSGLLRRLGLRSAGEGADTALVHALLEWMQATKVPFDQALFDLYGGTAGEGGRRSRSPVREAYAAGGGRAFGDLAAVLDAFEPSHPERLASPYLERDRPVAMGVGQVEAVWDAISLKDDWAPLEQLVAEVRELGALLEG